MSNRRRALGSPPLDAIGVDTTNHPHPVDKLLRGKATTRDYDMPSPGLGYRVDVPLDTRPIIAWKCVKCKAVYDTLGQASTTCTDGWAHTLEPVRAPQ